MSLDPDRPESSYHMGRFFAEWKRRRKMPFRALMRRSKIGISVPRPQRRAASFPTYSAQSASSGKLDGGKRTYHEKRI